MRGSEQSMVAAIRGPVTLITLGVLFALNNFTPYQFHQTWPVLLIVFGLLTLMRRATEPAPPTPAAGPYAPQYQYAPAPPYTPPAPPSGTAGGYRQSGYSEPAQPAAPEKGGFGTTSKPGDTEGGAL